MAHIENPATSEVIISNEISVDIFFLCDEIITIHLEDGRILHIDRAGLIENN